MVITLISNRPTHGLTTSANSMFAESLLGVAIITDIQGLRFGSVLLHTFQLPGEMLVDSHLTMLYKVFAIKVSQSTIIGRRGQTVRQNTSPKSC